MKSDMTTTVLNFVLLVLAICGVFFAISTFTRTRELRLIAPQASQDNNMLARMQLLANQVAEYNQKYPSPDLTRILQSIQSKPAAK
jgi:hypothetical protein